MVQMYVTEVMKNEIKQSPNDTATNETKFDTAFLYKK